MAVHTPSADAPEISPDMTAGAVLTVATTVLRHAGVPSPDLDALLLLAEATGASKATVLAHPERPLDEVPATRYADLVRRRAERVPLAYLLGRREFYGRELVVSPSVLVPRPETELLVDLALEYLRGREPTETWAADVGTGSGVLAVTLAAERPGLRLLATDCSQAALAVAQANAVRHGVADRVSLVCADLLAGSGGRFALIVANLPYIPTAAVDCLMPEVARHEPRLALDGGPDGLDLNRRLLAQARSRLAPNGLLLLEMGHDQGVALRAEAARLLPTADVAVVRDLAGCDRVLRVRNAGSHD